MGDRMLEIEETLAYQAKRLADLDGVVLAFTRRVEALERYVAELEERIQEAPEVMEPHLTPPPHY